MVETSGNMYQGEYKAGRYHVISQSVSQSVRHFAYLLVRLALCRDLEAVGVLGYDGAPQHATAHLGGEGQGCG
eukprot:scaffold19841_cov72-Phaeocystis_antarctica.AAC.3